MGPHSDICRYCDKPIADNGRATSHPYWSPVPGSCDKACKDAGIREEARLCQIVDADCNDCKYFKRGALLPLQAHVQASIDAGDAPGFTSQTFTGHCLKFDRPTF